MDVMRLSDPISTLADRVVASKTVTVILIGLLTTGCADSGQPSGEQEAHTNTTDAATVWFADEASERGLIFSYQSGHSDRHLMPEIIGGGAAVADVNGDGSLDIYLVQGGGIDRPVDAVNRLFLNDGHGQFNMSTDPGSTDTGYGMGVTAGDYDGDGDVDLYVTNLGPNALLRNDGNGHFQNIAGSAGVDDAGWGTAATFADFDVDGDLDLFLVNYVNWQLDTEQRCRSETTVNTEYCPPQRYSAPAPDRLYRNDGNGKFTDVTQQAGLQHAFGNGLGVGVSDFNGDGLVDVFVANDTMVNQLWINRGEMRFSDEAVAWGCAMDEHGVAKAGMGVVAVDYDQDGRTDILVMNLEGQTDSVFRNKGSYFTDASIASGLTRDTKRFTRFGVVMADFDNDGWLDIYEASGAIAVLPEPYGADPYAEPNMLLRGTEQYTFEPTKLLGGTNQPVVSTSRGVAAGDVNNDGAIDLVVVNRDAPVSLLMNQVGTRRNWLSLTLQNKQGQVIPNARLTGRIGDRSVTREVQTAGGYLSAHDPRIHVGMGPAQTLEDVTVLWPDKTRDSYGDLKTGQQVKLVKGLGKL